MRIRAEGIAFIERHDPTAPQVLFARRAHIIGYEMGREGERERERKRER